MEKLRGCRYERIEGMKEAVTKVIDTLTQEDFHGAFQKFLERYNKGITKVIDTLTQEDFHGAFQRFLERYNKGIAAGWDYFEGDLTFMCVLSIKLSIRKKSGNLWCAPCIYMHKHSHPPT